MGSEQIAHMRFKLSLEYVNRKKPTDPMRVLPFNSTKIVKHATLEPRES